MKIKISHFKLSDLFLFYLDINFAYNITLYELLLAQVERVSIESSELILTLKL